MNGETTQKEELPTKLQLLRDSENVSREDIDQIYDMKGLTKLHNSRFDDLSQLVICLITIMQDQKLHNTMHKTRISISTSYQQKLNSNIEKKKLMAQAKRMEFARKFAKTGEDSANVSPAIRRRTDTLACEKEQDSQKKPSLVRQETFADFASQAKPGKRKRLLKRCQKRSKQIINHWLVVILMTLLTLYALFFDDFTVLWLSPAANYDAIDAVTCGVIVAFTAEIILHSIADPSYINSFFFWLDFISTVSMFFDINWLLDESDSSGYKTTSAANIAKTARAARVTRIIRLVRLVRLLRIVKLYKQAKIAQNIIKEKENEELENKLNQEYEQMQEFEQQQEQIAVEELSKQKILVTNEDPEHKRMKEVMSPQIRGKDSASDVISQQSIPNAEVEKKKREMFRRASLMPLFFRYDSLQESYQSSASGLKKPSNIAVVPQEPVPLPQIQIREERENIIGHIAEEENEKEDASTPRSNSSKSSFKSQQSSNKPQDLSQQASHKKAQTTLLKVEYPKPRNSNRRLSQQPLKEGLQIVLSDQEGRSQQAPTESEQNFGAVQSTKHLLQTQKSPMLFQRSQTNRKPSFLTVQPRRSSNASKNSNDLKSSSPSKIGILAKETKKFGLMLAKALNDSDSSDSSDSNSSHPDPNDPTSQLYRKQSSQQNLEENINELEDGVSKIKESRVSRTYSERVTKIVIMIILGMLFASPFFEQNTFFSEPIAQQHALDQLAALKITLGNDTQAESFQKMWNYTVESLSSEEDPLLALYIPGQPQYSSDEYEDELSGSDYALIETSWDQDAWLVYSIHKQNRIQSIINICRTIFVMILLLLASVELNHIANKLVLEPIERMSEKVKILAYNPLGVFNDDADNLGMLNVVAKHQLPTDDNETSIIEHAIVKISKLLALGFGEAGSQIVANNLRRAGDLNFCLEGQKMLGIFGFCDIRNFTDTTEVLEVQVMAYVNQIAEIVHAQVDKYLGQANKNIGDAFLLVWKYPHSYLRKHSPRMASKRRRSTAAGLPLKQKMKVDWSVPQVRVLADLALFSFLKIIAKINKFEHIRNYSRNADIRAKLGSDFKVKMGFGLHFGWAIEGAIGSQYKIDASYLSPNVNIASRLEAATKQYGVPLLVSGQFHSLLSDRVQSFTRQVDCVMVKGSKKPLSLYTVSLYQENLVEIEDRFQGITVLERKKERLQEKRTIAKRVLGGMVQSFQLFERDEDLREMRRGVNPEFEEEFRNAYKKYIDGKWTEAYELIQEALILEPTDGPSITLREYLLSQRLQAPKDWKGCRELVEK